MVTYAMTEQMLPVRIWVRTNEFIKSGFTELPSEQVGPPRVVDRLYSSNALY